MRGRPGVVACRSVAGGGAHHVPGAVVDSVHGHAHLRVAGVGDLAVADVHGHVVDPGGRTVVGPEDQVTDLEVVQGDVLASGRILGLGVQRQLNVGLRERVLNEAGAVVVGRAISTPDVTDARIGSLGRSSLHGRPQPVLLEEAVE